MLSVIKERRNIISILFTLVFFFRQVVFFFNPDIGYQIVGNFDLFYLLGIIYIVFSFKKNESRFWVFGAIVATYLSLQILFLEDIDLARAIINVLKILLCYFVMMGAIKFSKKINIKIVTISFGILCGLFLIIACLFYNSPILWRLNDTINVFDLHRLKLLYTEPGELGMHCALMLIPSTYVFMNTKKRVKYSLVAIAPTLACLMLTRSLGGIIVGAIGVMVVLILDLRFSFSKKKLLRFSAIIASCSIVVIVSLFLGNSILQRIDTVFSHGDSSTRYRLTVAFDVAGHAFYDTGGLGVGFGNLELPTNVDKYNVYGMNSAGIINSFMNLVAESGLFGIAMICLICYMLIRASIKARDPVRFGLSIFVIIYQFGGTYFTNPLYWIIYGYILAPIVYKHTKKYMEYYLNKDNNNLQIYERNEYEKKK